MSAPVEERFNSQCTRCPRLVAHLDTTRITHSNYHNGPVSSFGARHPRLLIVGLAPGMHGANRTGRAFTGDASGALLFACLHRSGLSSLPMSDKPHDGLILNATRITNIVKCLPPLNRPTSTEVKACTPYLAREIAQLPKRSCILALGRVAYENVVRILGAKPSGLPFAHGGEYIVDGRHVIASYHCSRLNVNTGRLTAKMLQQVTDRTAQIAGIAPL
jgi:uracil-DNA glycosylase family 4